MKQLTLLLLFSTFLLTNCAQSSTSSYPPTANNSQPTSVQPQPTNPQSPISSPQPSPATPQPTQLPSPTPQPPILATLTPAPVAITVAVVPEWEPLLAEIITDLNTQSEIRWQLIVNDNPTANLAENSAQIALSKDESGTLVYQEVTVISVPLTTDWEALTLAEAEEILRNGHSLAEVGLWQEMPAMHKSLRIDGYAPDDAAYPLQNRLTLTAVPNTETAVTILTAALEATLQPNPVFRLTSVGDIMLDRRLGQTIRNGNLAYPFANVTSYFNEADITIGNMESSLGTLGTPVEKSYPFQAPPEAAQALALAGIDVVTLANNHAMDYGAEALLDGIDLLKAANVTPIGGGENFAAAHTPYITDLNGLSLALFGYVNVPIEGVSNFDTQTWTATASEPGLAWGNPAEITADITAVNDQVDLIAVILHSGFEYTEEPGEAQVAAAKAAIDAGADLVIGHHAHILQGIEYYNGGVIVYGLGNFAFDIDGDPRTAILNVWLDKNGVRDLELIPAIIETGGQPRIADEGEAKTILQKVYFLTTLLN